ncbi:MAG: sulfurtransferase TusA family protein [Sphingomonadales bacterium]|nr:sulfurtransferase TusA family protein [Sphingomonadales bacterium]
MTVPRAEAFRVDTRGLKCPWPVLRAARAMREHADILLLSDDQVARTDVPALAAAQGWTVTLRQGPDHDEYRLSRPQE